MCYSVTHMEANQGEHRDSDEPRVGIRELRHDFRAWLERVRSGERVIVTDRGHPIAELVPHRPARSWLQQMCDEGLVIRARRPAGDLPERVMVGGGISTAGTDALQEQREERLL